MAERGLTCCLLEGAELEAEKKKAEGLKKIEISARVKGDLIMMGIGGFSPLTGFMTKADWKGVCENFPDGRRHLLAHPGNPGRQQRRR
jgi:sulfate adenylyltransferase